MMSHVQRNHILINIDILPATRRLWTFKDLYSFSQSQSGWPFSAGISNRKDVKSWINIVLKPI